MNFFHRFAGATNPAWKSFCFVLAIICLGNLTAHAGQPRVSDPAKPLLSGDVVVTVTPLSAWQSQYPSCTLSAQADACGDTPTVSFTGDSCYPSSGTMNIARVDVVDAPAECAHAYMVQAVGGGIHVVIIDP